MCDFGNFAASGRVTVELAAGPATGEGEFVRTRRIGIVTALCLVLSLFVADLTGPVAPASAAGGGVVDLTGSVVATFTVTPGVEQMTITGATPRAPLTIAHADTLERIITLYTDDLGQLVVQYVPDSFLVFDPQTQGVLPTLACRTS